MTVLHSSVNGFDDSSGGDGGTNQYRQQQQQLEERREDRSTKHFLETTNFVVTPFLVSFVSFFFYPTTSRLFHATAQLLSNNNWVPVDGGQLQWSILLPALNGVVMTAISLLYANLISTTGTQLRNRQIRIQESLSSEVDGIRGLVQLLPYYPPTTKSLCGAHLMVYIKLLVSELGPYTEAKALRSSVPPLASYRDNLHKGSITHDDDDPTSTTTTGTIHSNILERSYEMLDRVSNGRSSRITALQNTFPPLHYVTISALTAAILFVFLIETDRPVILFLDNFQLRLIWSLLVGTLTAIVCIGIDLNNPFVGTYTVPADQLLDESEDLISLIQDTATSTATTGTAGFAAAGAGAVMRQPQQQQPQPQQQQSFPQAPQPLSQPPVVPPPLPSFPGGVTYGQEETGRYGAGASISGGGGVARDHEEGVVQDPNAAAVAAAAAAAAAAANGEQATSFEEYMRRRSDGSMGE